MKRNKLEQRHDKHIKKIWESPPIIGLEKIALSSRETRMFYDDRLYHQSDNLCFDPFAGIIYNIEYKTSNEHKHKAMKQLIEQKKFLKEMFNRKYNVVNLYVHNNYQIEVI